MNVGAPPSSTKKNVMGNQLRRIQSYTYDDYLKVKNTGGPLAENMFTMSPLAKNSQGKVVTRRQSDGFLEQTPGRSPKVGAEDDEEDLMDGEDE